MGNDGRPRVDTGLKGERLVALVAGCALLVVCLVVAVHGQRGAPGSGAPACASDTDGLTLPPGFCATVAPDREVGPPEGIDPDAGSDVEQMLPTPAGVTADAVARS